MKEGGYPTYSRIGSIILVDAFSSENFVMPRSWLIKMGESFRLLGDDEIQVLESTSIFDAVLSGLGADQKTINNLNPEYSEAIFPRISVQEFLQKYPTAVDEDDDQYGFGRVLKVASNAATFNDNNLFALKVYEMSQTKTKDALMNFLVELGRLDWKSASSFMFDGATREDVQTLSVGIHEPDFRLSSVKGSTKEANQTGGKIVYTFKYGLERRFADKGQTDITMAFNIEKKHGE